MVGVSESEKEEKRREREKPYDEYGDQDVLLGDLSVREDALQHRGHVRLVLLPQVDHTLVVVSCSQKGIKKK